ncbi:MAG: hypothetical protein ACT4QE_18780 [Anaerolineales bacterium]
MKQLSSPNLWALLTIVLAALTIGGALYIVITTQATGGAAVSETSSPMTQTSIVPQPTDELPIILTQKANIGATAAARPPTTPEVEPTGIYDDEKFKAQWQAFGFNVQNAWFGIVSGILVTVFAGAPSSDQQQGMLKVSVILPYREFQGEFTTLDKQGSLSVVAEQNNRLILTSTDGTTFYFDVPAMRFVSSLTEVASTMTPLPTYTPIVFPTEAPPATGYPQPSQTPQPTSGYPPPTTQATITP